MNNRLSSIFVLLGCLALAMCIGVNIFAGGQNVIGKAFYYITPAAFFFGLMNPRFSLYALVFSSTLLDVAKRLMIIDNRFSYMDIAFILAFAPALLAGMGVNCFLKAVWSKSDVLKRQLWIFLACLVVSAVLGASYALGNEFGLRSLGDGVNASAYTFLAFCLPMIMHDRQDLRKLMIFWCICYLIPAIWCIKQGMYGLADFEYSYLRSGFTNEARQLNEIVMRNMGSLVSASALSLCLSSLIVMLVIPMNWKSGRLTFHTWFSLWRVGMVLLLAIGAYYTFSRTGWICGIFAILIFIVLQRKWLFYPSMVMALVSVVALYLSADFLFKSDFMNRWQQWLMIHVAKSAESEQTLVLGTINGRLESMANVVHNSHMWTPFGHRFSPEDALAIGNVEVHDVLSEMLVLVGYIPLSIAGLIGIFVFVLFVKANFNIANEADRNYFRFFIALGSGLLVAGLSQGKVLFVFPVNFFWCFFFSAAFVVYIRYRESLVKVPQQPAPSVPEKRRERVPDFPIPARSGRV
ncbi:MAG: hypothetical protein QM755_19930 [Luteolibacter sp.]